MKIKIDGFVLSIIAVNRDSLFFSGMGTQESKIRDRCD